MDILQANGLDHTKRIKDFSEDEIAKIRKSIDESYTVEGDLRRVVSQNIKRLKLVLVTKKIWVKSHYIKEGVKNKVYELFYKRT